MAIHRPLIPTPPSEETESHFSSTPWASSFFQDKSLIPIINESRIIRPNSTRESLCSQTLSTPSTISAWQNFYHLPSPEKPFGQITAVVKLGSGVNGHTDIAHGGFVGLLLDEVIGMACGYQRKEGQTALTAYLNIGYKKPVETPAVVLCRGWVERKEGKKVWGKATVEDGAGEVLATGDALFIVIEGSQVKL